MILLCYTRVKISESWNDAAQAFYRRTSPRSPSLISLYVPVLCFPPERVFTYLVDLDQFVLPPPGATSFDSLTVDRRARDSLVRPRRSHLTIDQAGFASAFARTIATDQKNLPQKADAAARVFNFQVNISSLESRPSLDGSTNISPAPTERMTTIA